MDLLSADAIGRLTVSFIVVGLGLSESISF